MSHYFALRQVLTKFMQARRAVDTHDCGASWCPGIDVCEVAVVLVGEEIIAFKALDKFMEVNYD